MTNFIFTITKVGEPYKWYETGFEHGFEWVKKIEVEEFGGGENPSQIKLTLYGDDAMYPYRVGDKVAVSLRFWLSRFLKKEPEQMVSVVTIEPLK